MHIWWTRRALMLHLVALVVVPGFLALAWWQLMRALGGNGLSWAYTFEWPFFAGYGVFVWWRLVHDQRHRTEVPPVVGEPEERPVGWALVSGRAHRQGRRADRQVRNAERRAARPTAAQMAALALAEAAAGPAGTVGAGSVPGASPPVTSGADDVPGASPAGPASPLAPAPATTARHADRPDPGAPDPGVPESEDVPESEEDRALAEYNAYLAALSASGKRKHW